MLCGCGPERKMKKNSSVHLKIYYVFKFFSKKKKKTGTGIGRIQMETMCMNESEGVKYIKHLLRQCEHEMKRDGKKRLSCYGKVQRVKYMPPHTSKQNDLLQKYNT